MVKKNEGYCDASPLYGEECSAQRLSIVNTEKREEVKSNVLHL